MNEKYIKKLIRLVEESEIESLEVHSWGRKVKITQRAVAQSNGHGDTTAVIQQVVPPRHQAAPAEQPLPATTPPPEETPAVVDKSKLVPITSPMVGTFYSAPAPDADPYVSLNEKVRVGQVICIVEAMKLMNEIESEVTGRVVEITVGNAEPVEFGQTLFLIDPE